MNNQLQGACKASSDFTVCAQCTENLSWHKKELEGSFFYQTCLKKASLKDWLAGVAQLESKAILDSAIIAE